MKLIAFLLAASCLSCGQVVITGNVTIGGNAGFSMNPPPVVSGLSPLFFGLNWAGSDPVNPPVSTPWPSAFGTNYARCRNWDTTGTRWYEIETARGSYTWTKFNAWANSCTGTVAGAILHITNGVATTPTWANGAADNIHLPSDVTDTTTVCYNVPDPFRGGGAAGLVNGDCQWVEFVVELAKHLCVGCNFSSNVFQGTLNVSLSTGNEVNLAQFANPTCVNGATTACQNMARMQADAYKVFHYVDCVNAVVGTPSFANDTSRNPPDGSPNESFYLSVSVPGYGGVPGDFSDVLIFHHYGNFNAMHVGRPEVAGPDTGTCSSCRAWPSFLADFHNLLTSGNHMLNKPMWIDEGGWGENWTTRANGTQCTSDCGCPPSRPDLGVPTRACLDADLLTNETLAGSSDAFTLTNAPAPGYYARAMMEAIAGGVSAFFWYHPNVDNWGSFGDCLNTCSVPSDYRATATTYAQNAFYAWAVGSVFEGSGIHNPSGSQYTYNITGKDSTKNTGCGGGLAAPGYTAQVVWDINGSSSYSTTYGHWCSLFENASSPYSAGIDHAVVGGTVTVGPIPILLER